MDSRITQLVVYLAVALVCVGIATIFVPRRTPGGFFGGLLIGLAGIALGDWGFAEMDRSFGIKRLFPVLNWQIPNIGVKVIPAIVGCTVVLFVVTLVLRWFRYNSRI
ncbi:hypothetical protein [Leptolyngbya sp. FACHB-261]|uniref:hypothetical protein n=1 Tax=Leptolyngbya sp. FACHB-261 TaxID=2692806 RepID=UPI001686BB01|nr:hypothetical protein [Leptolyngbya sp. FACHB-261]MBD2099335.1 hypothetical protein [Leptolyngbya sp. FACHB-261]